MSPRTPADDRPEGSEEPTVVQDPSPDADPIDDVTARAGDADGESQVWQDIAPDAPQRGGAAESTPTTGSKAADGVAAAADAVKERAGAAKLKADAAKERAADAAKETGGRMRGGMGRARTKAGTAASDAKELAAKATAEARERAASADVEGFARSTTSLIDTARPFFLAGCAAIFAILGFLEGHDWTSAIFAFGAILCVGGAAFSAEFNALLHARATRDQRRLPLD